MRPTALVFLLLLCALCTRAGAQAGEYPIDGRGHHPDVPEWGAVGQPHVRIFDAAPEGTYSGFAPARVVSNAMSPPLPGRVEPDLRPSLGGISLFHVFFGQFSAHEIAATSFNSSQMLSEPAPADDPFLPEGAPVFFPRGEGEPFNTITPWIDASAVYGSSQEFLDALVDEETGLLHYRVHANREQRPTAEQVGLEGRMERVNSRVDGSKVPAAGDVRNAENSGLGAMHDLFLRLHNHLVRTRHAGVEDPMERFRLARRDVIAVLQKITFEEWLPAVVAEEDLRRAEALASRSASKGPEMSLEAMIAHRFGHTQIAPVVPLFGRPSRPLADDYFMAPDFSDPAVDPVSIVLLGAMETPSENIDSVVVHALRNQLFNDGSARCADTGCGFDLVFFTLMRGRDLLVNTYERSRVLLGLDDAPNPNLPAQREQDLFSGALLEAGKRTDGKLDPVMGTLMAEFYMRVKLLDPSFYSKHPDSPHTQYAQTQTSATLAKQFLDGMADFDPKDQSAMHQVDWDSASYSHGDGNSDGVVAGAAVGGVIGGALLALAIHTIVSSSSSSSSAPRQSSAGQKERLLDGAGAENTAEASSYEQDDAINIDDDYY